MTLLGAALLASAVLPAPVSARYGPKFSVPRARLNAAMECYRPPERLGKPPVLLVHGTATGPDQTWSWNYGLTLPEQRRPTCTVRLPQRALGDMQISQEYVANAIKWASQRGGDQKVDVIGHSQGGVLPRAAVRFWPGARKLVDDMILLAPSSHGVIAAGGLCAVVCNPAVWQQRQGSQYLAALNRGDETPGKVSYTTIWSIADEIIQPSSSGALEGASNNSIQRTCPGRIVNHAGILFDATAYELVNDALRHKGPAIPAAATEETCSRVGFPGASVAGDVIANNLTFYLDALPQLGLQPQASKEPELRPYARR